MTPVPPLVVIPVVAAIFVVNLVERNFNRPSFRVTKLLSGLLFLAIGARAAYWFIAEGLPGFASKSWPPVSATVDSTRLQSRYRRYGVGWASDIFYTYTVSGKAYHSGTVTFPARRGVRYVADSLSVGHTVTAYYNPSDPAQACLERGGSWWFAIVASGLTVVFLSSGIAVLRSLRRS